jgi:hypothetical protein
LISWPFTTAHTSGEGWDFCLQPVPIASAIAITGSSAVARGSHFMGLHGRTTALILGCEGFKVWCSGSFLHAACADAGRANSNMLPRAVYQRVDALQVRIPPSAPCIIRVTDHVAKVRPFAAKFTLQCHCFSYLGCL